MAFNFDRATILVVDSDTQRRVQLRDALVGDSFDSVTVADISEEVRRAASGCLAAFVTACGTSWCEVLATLRQQQVRVIALVPSHAVAEEALAAGAADFLTMKYAPWEPAARVRALLSPEHLDAELNIDIDESTRAVRVAGETLELTATEFELLVTLARRPGVAVRRRDLVMQTRPDGDLLIDRVIDGHVWRLRRKLSRWTSDEVIATARGFGYRYVAPAPTFAPAPPTVGMSGDIGTRAV